MTRRILILSLLIAFASVDQPTANAQIKAAEADEYLKLGDVQISRYRVGVTLDARRGAVRNVLAVFPVPLTCAEQEVELVEEDITENIGMYEYRGLVGGEAKQMVIKIPYLPNKSEARAVLTFDVRTRIILPPDDTAELSIPPKKPPRELKRFLGKSPMIETKHSKIKKLLREIFSPSENEAATELTDWQRVETIYNFVQDRITYKEQEDKSAVTTLRDGHGDCHNVSALFVALCRTYGIPARMVWVDQHQYPEFCLLDPEGKPHWFPCESSGQRAFGEMPLTRVIMQKGDNFKVPETRESKRYAAEYMTGVPAAPGGGPPSHKFIRERL